LPGRTQDLTPFFISLLRSSCSRWLGIVSSDCTLYEPASFVRFRIETYQRKCDTNDKHANGYQATKDGTACRVREHRKRAGASSAEPKAHKYNGERMNVHGNEYPTSGGSFGDHTSDLR